MTINGWLQILFFFALILAVTKPMGIFIARVFNRERTFLDPVLRPIERLIYRLTGVDEERIVLPAVTLILCFEALNVLSDMIARLP